MHTFLAKVFFVVHQSQEALHTLTPALNNYLCMYSETSLVRHSMGPENNVGFGGCWIMECLLPYLCMVTVPHIMVRLERMLDYRGVGLVRFHCTWKFYNVLLSDNV